MNPHARAIHSVRAYPSVEAIPDAVDLAVMVVPKEHVVAVAEECGRKGVRGLVVISRRASRRSAGRGWSASGS